jgi:integrase/recombinase XerD
LGGLDGARSPVADTLCPDWVVQLRAEGKKARTITSYKSALKLYLGFIAENKVAYDLVTHRLCTRWLVHLLDVRKMKPRAINSALSAIKSFYRWLRIENYMYADPLRDVRCMKAPRLLPKPISEEWCIKIIEASKTPFERAFLETLYATGGRIGELESMRIGGVDLKAKRLACMGKGDRERLLQIGGPAVLALEAWLSFRAQRGEALLPSDPLWVGNKRLKMDRKTFRKYLKDVAIRAGFKEKVWPHRFRHSFCTHLLDHGADLRQVQELAGHENIVSTTIYTEVSTARQRTAFEKAHPRA